MIAVSLAAVMAVSVSGCSFNITVNENSTASSVSVSDDSSADSSEEESLGEESTDESSDEQSQPEEVSEETPDESTDGNSMTESEAAEVSIDGYQFDDEQIVTDYHTAEEFTKNEEFNKLFRNNAIDTDYNDRLLDAMTLKDMREATIEFASVWKEEVGMVYDILCDMLKDKPDDLKKLEDSQKEWEDSLAVVESSFDAESLGNGTEAMLSADTAMMNYYKGRAAVLLEQIYELEGNNIALIEYGL